MTLHMNDKAAFQYINTVNPVDWFSQSEYVHDDYKWIISPDTLECTTYHHKKPIRYSLELNQLIDGSSPSNIFTQSVTTIARYLIDDNDIIFVPIGTTWTQLVVDNRIKAIVLTTYNNIVKISLQCTFDCNVSLPVGLPLFNNTVDKIIGFVGRRLPNNRYIIDAASSQRISKHIMTNEKINIHFINLVLTNNNQPIVKSQKRVVIYGNMLCEKGISTQKIRDLETRSNDNNQEKRINVIQKEDGVVINITNGINENADELESFSFINTKFIKYFILPPREEFVVDDEEKIIVTNARKNKKHKHK